MQVQIAERKRAEQALEHQAFHDALTGLPNRALFTDRLEHALARANRRATTVAVLFLGLDTSKWSTQAMERLELETDLLHALGRGEFQVHYQLIVSLSDDSIRGGMPRRPTASCTP